jgi:serine/threonine protein kinase
MAFPLQFFLLCIGLFNFCLATTPPKGAPISSYEWALCEKFIQTKAHSFFSQGIYYIPKDTDRPYPIEKDQTTGFIYVHLKGNQGAFLGKGSYKLVTMSILYGNRPRLVARCETNQEGLREAQILSHFRNLRGVIQCISYIPSTKHSCTFFLDYYNCGALDAIVKKKIHIKDSEILPIMQDLLIGLKGIHDHGYIHRDIKIENIFLHREKKGLKAVLGDLGHVLEMDKELDSHITIHRPTCAPETLLFPNRNIDRKKAEIFSLGDVFYAVLFEKLPQWSPLIPVRDLESIPQEEKLMIYNCLTSSYRKRLERDCSTLKGIRKEAAVITFQMLNPNPLQRISLDEALDKINALFEHYTNQPYHAIPVQE